MDIQDFFKERDDLNRIVLDSATLETKRFLSLDNQVYRDGALPRKTKELLGLIASFVLRCDDCVLYHLKQCSELGVTDDELREALGVGLIAGGSITIPHLRKAVKSWGELKENN